MKVGRQTVFLESPLSIPPTTTQRFERNNEPTLGVAYCLSAGGAAAPTCTDHQTEARHAGTVLASCFV